MRQQIGLLLASIVLCAVFAIPIEKGGRITLRNNSDRALLAQMRGGLGVIYGDIALDVGYTGTLGCEWVWYKVNAYSANDNRMMCTTGDPIDVYCGDTVEIRGSASSGYKCVEVIRAQNNSSVETNGHIAKLEPPKQETETNEKEKAAQNGKKFDYIEVSNETGATIKARLTIEGPIYADIALERRQSGLLACEQVWYEVQAHEANTNAPLCSTGSPTSVYCGKSVIVRRDVNGTIVCQERWIPPQ
eukprot:TRINITY_DN19950_c0_g1_i1.p1 TRINITY_DN19950_c0_g1~~TRINITY_DN19950_c0_g1_i1.p1  ORF type:complete len:246 (+),score=54.23 TRINITY_DN19950_c0_g1_i1:48-785(+)